MKYTVIGYGKDNSIMEMHDTNEIASAYEYYRHLGTPKGQIVDNTYSEIFEDYGFED